MGSPVQNCLGAWASSGSQTITIAFHHSQAAAGGYASEGDVLVVKAQCKKWVYSSLCQLFSLQRWGSLCRVTWSTWQSGLVVKVTTGANPSAPPLPRKTLLPHPDSKTLYLSPTSHLGCKRLSVPECGPMLHTPYRTFTTPAGVVHSHCSRWRAPDWALSLQSLPVAVSICLHDKAVLMRPAKFTQQRRSSEYNP